MKEFMYDDETFWKQISNLDENSDTFCFDLFSSWCWEIETPTLCRRHLEKNIWINASEDHVDFYNK